MITHPQPKINLIPTSIYIHLPFCRRRCYYCDFPISVVGDNGDKSKAAEVSIAEYIKALIRDIELTTPQGQPIETIFFGGGTPSLVAPQRLSTIIQTVADRFGLAENIEISMEIDPGTFDRDRLQGYLDIGINRYSLGVQTFDPELLQICGRSHGLDDVMEAVDLMRQLNIDNFSLDLITGLPHQTLEHCRRSLESAIAIAPRHLSCYDLVLEPVTAFGKQYQPGETPLPNDEDTAEMYRLTQAMLTAAGYEHYEVSNYAQPGYQCRHNRVYWENKPYYAFGMGAASYVDGIRFTRPRTRREYYSWLKAGKAIDEPKLSSEDRLLETLMLGLRLAEGIRLDRFDVDTWQQIKTCIEPYYRQGWVEIADDRGNLIELNRSDVSPSYNHRIRLNDPEGFLFSNTILATLFEKL